MRYDKAPPPEQPRNSHRSSASYPAQSHRSAQIRNFSNATYYITGVNQSHIKISKAFPSLTFVAVLATAYVRVRLVVCVHLLPARACVCDKTLTLEPFPITVCNKYYVILAFRNLEESYTRINIHDIFFLQTLNINMYGYYFIQGPKTVLVMAVYECSHIHRWNIFGENNN